MLRVQLSGYLGSDAEVRNHEGKVFFNFSVANNFSVKRENQWVEETRWEQCSMVVEKEKTKNVDYLKNVLVKGTFVLAENMHYHTKAYTNKNGEKKASLRWFIKSSDITIIQPTKRVLEPVVPNTATPEDVPDDLPF